MTISKIVNKIEDMDYLIEQLKGNDTKPMDMVTYVKIIGLLSEYKRLLLNTNIKSMVYERNYE